MIIAILLSLAAQSPDTVVLSLDGTPYGASHLSPQQEHTQLTDEEARIAEHLGRRVASFALRLAATGRP